MRAVGCPRYFFKYIANWYGGACYVVTSPSYRSPPGSIRWALLLFYGPILHFLVRFPLFSSNLWLLPFPYLKLPCGYFATYMLLFSFTLRYLFISLISFLLPLSFPSAFCHNFFVYLPCFYCFFFSLLRHYLFCFILSYVWIVLHSLLVSCYRVTANSISYLNIGV